MDSRIVDLIKPAKKAMIITACITAVGGVLGIVPYVALTEIAAAWSHDAPARTLWTWLVVAIVSAILYTFLYGIGLGLTHMAEASLRYTLRKRLVNSFGRIPLGRVDQTSSGAIRKMVVDDTTSIHTLVAHLSGDATNAGVAFIAGLAYLFWVDWRMTLALLAIWVLVIVLIAGVMIRGFGDMTKKFSKAQTELAAATVEMVEGIKEIKNFQASELARTRFDRARQHFSDISYEWMHSSGKPTAIISAFLQPAVIFATVAPLAVLFVSQGWIELAYTLPFFMIGIGLPAGLIQFVQITQHLYTAHQAATDTADILDIPYQSEGPKSEGPGDDPGAVEFRNVHFSYEADKPIIRGISARIEPGSVTALVGPSGGGKTTLARLIARFYDVDEGAVVVSGHDVRDVTAQWLLSQISIVFQDVALAADTVANNIALGKPGATHEEIVQAARAACIHDRIERLPDGYETVIGSEGGFLSGGEKQRITIARAYLHDAPILILDEATAQADPQSERAIHEALSTLSKNRTVIIIAHRLATIANADQILVISDGEVVEAGVHGALVNEGGVYANLWARQQLALTQSQQLALAEKGN